MNLDPLYDAAIAGNADARAKLEMQTDILNKDEYTILHTEAKKGNAERVRFILREFAHKNLLTKSTIYKHTALHLAIYEGHTEVAEVLIHAATDLPPPSFQAFLRQGDFGLDSALHAAVTEGNITIVKLLVEADPTDRHIQNYEGKTPMYIAVEKGYNEIVEIISTTCTDPSLDGPDGSGVVRINDLHQVESHGGTLYKIKDRYAFYDAAIAGDAEAIDKKISELVRFFVRRRDANKIFLTKITKYCKLNKLYDAAIAGDADARAKLEMQADKLGEKEYTILHTEAKKGNAQRVRFLLKEFASKNLLVKLNRYKQTALHLAALHGHTEVAEVLIHAARDLPPSSFQAFLRQGDKDMDTALHAAVLRGNVAIVKLLVEADPTDRHIQNHRGKTPMYIAVEKGLNEIVDIISTTCTDPSLDGPYGDTVVRINDLDQVDSPGGTLYKIKDRYAFYDAAIAGDAEAIAKLEMEADKLDYYDQTILHAESRRGKTECVRFLLKEFASKNLLVKLNKYKRTALHLAALHGHTEVAEVLIDAATHLPNDDTHDNPVTSFQAFLRRGDEDMNTALHLAVKKGQVDIVKLLVEADPTDTHIQNHQGKTPMYIAAKRGYLDVVKIMCTTCTVPINLDGPGTTTALHPVIKKLDKDNKEKRDLIRLIINAVKIVNIPEDAESLLSDLIHLERDERLVQLFKKTDEDRCTILELAVERNYGDVVELILAENPAYQYETYYSGGRLDHDLVGLLPLIYKAGDKEYRDVLQLLNQRFETLRVSFFSKGNIVPLLSAIRSHNLESVLWLLDKFDTKVLVNFIDDVGWTALHHAAYNELNEVIKPIVEAQKKFGHEFVYPDKRPTPFHVAAQKGFTSTVILLFELWPSSSSSAYIAIDKDGQNILHLAALQSKKEMIQAILKYCPEEYKKDFVNKQDNNGNTPLHLLIRRGCLVPELLRYQGLDTTVKNDKKWTPRDMLYVDDEIIEDQVKIKIALDHIQIDQKRDLFSSSVLSISKREEKDAIMKKQANQMIHQMHARMKGDTRAVANCFADAIAGDPISKAALEMEADTLQEEGKTILHVESMRGVTDRVEYILREFAIKNLLVKLDISKQTALHLAVHHGHTQVVEALIEAATHLPSWSANDDTHNPIRSFQDFIRRTNGQMGNTALHLAVFNGNLAIVKLLVQADPNDNHVQNNEGKTPMYIAAENGYKDIVKEICTTCTALSLDGPGGRTTILHSLVQNAGQGASDMIRMIVEAAKRWSTSNADYEALFCRTDELGSTVLQLAVDRDYVNAVELILQEDPAYQQGREIKRNGLMRLIYKAIDKNCSDDIIKLLSKAYEAGIVVPDHEHVLALILAMKRRDEDSVLRLLGDAKGLVTFTEDNGWTPLHYAVYHEFDSVLGAIIGAQEDVGHQFVYGDLVSTPFHVAIEHGYTSTLVRLMQLWPALSSAFIADKSPYTVVNKDGQNILHLAAADNKKEMVQGILKYCPGMYKDKILKQQDINGDTPLHVLISQGCFIPELIKDEGLDTMAKNKYSLTPWEMLYFKNDVVADQVEIKIAIDDVQTNQSAWNILCAKSTEKETDIWKHIPPSKRRIKDVMFDEQKIKLMDAKLDRMYKKKLPRYQRRSKTQIIVTALIATVTFTAGFTMPGGLHQSGEVDEGLVVLSRKTAFTAFMVSDAIALLLSTCSLFLYFLETMCEDYRQLSLLNAASVALNIVSVVAMMLTFITGTFLVLSNSPALAITVCLIGSSFFVFVIFLLTMLFVIDRQVKRNED